MMGSHNYFPSSSTCFLHNSPTLILTSMGSKGLSIMLTHLGRNPDWSILDRRMSSVTCAMRVCNTTSIVANQRLNASDCVKKEVFKREK